MKATVAGIVRSHKEDELVADKNPGDEVPAGETALNRVGRSAPQLSKSVLSTAKQLQESAAMADHGWAAISGLRQQYAPIAAAAQQALDARERIGQFAADMVGTSVIDAVTRSQKLLGNSASYSVAQAISRGALGDSMITANLTALNAGARVLELAELMAPAAALTKQVSAQFTGIQQVAQLVERQNQQLIRLHPAWDIARPASLSTRAFEDVLRTAASAPTAAQYMERVDTAGHTTGWALSASMELTAPMVGTELETASETTLGPAGASSELRARLAAIDSDLPVKLDGAWERIDNGGTDAGRQAAHSLMEAVDWTLRLKAPEDAVLAWYEDQEPKPSEGLDAKQRPTRALKLRYIVRENPNKGTALNMYRRAIGDLVGALQDPKHGSRTTDPRTLAAVAMTVEGFLLFVVGE
jgi:hypothetical protein